MEADNIKEFNAPDNKVAYNFLINPADDDPSLYDVAFAFIDESGDVMPPREILVKTLGYRPEDIPRYYEDIKQTSQEPNFFFLTGHATSVVFIPFHPKQKNRTLGSILHFLDVHKDFLQDKSVWIPYLDAKLRRSDPFIEIIIESIRKERLQSLWIFIPDSTPYEEQKFIEAQIHEWNHQHYQHRITEYTKNRHFFIAGYNWGNEDEWDDEYKLHGFLNEGRWNDPGETPGALQNASPGDILLAKSSWEKGPIKGILTVQAIGIVTKNHTDGNQLDVSWHQFYRPMKLAASGQYRSAFERIEVDYVADVLLELTKEEPNLFLILKGLSQENDIDKVRKIISNRLHGGNNFWWINAGGKWRIDDLEIGQSQSYSAKEVSGIYETYTQRLRKHDLALGYQAKPENSIIGLFAITRELNEEGRYEFELFYKFRQPPTYDELKSLPLFGTSPLSKSLRGSLHLLDVDLFAEIIQATELKVAPVGKQVTDEQKNALIANDGAYSADDLLDIENDVRAFALLLATKAVKPPIAIALFGQWGSGKSFFMKHLTKRVQELSINQAFVTESSLGGRDASEEPFCKGIAQIQFNAWSYLDANLWAGLIASIFEKLDEYITKRGKGDEAKRQIREKLSRELHVLSTEKSHIQEKKDDLIKQKNDLTKKLEKLREAKDSIPKRVAAKKWDEIKEEALNKMRPLEEHTLQLLDEYGIGSEQVSQLQSHPNALYLEVSSWVTFMRNLGHLSTRALLIGLAAFALLVFVWVDPRDLATEFFQDAGRLITASMAVVAPLVAKWHTSYYRFKKLIGPVSAYKDEFNRALREAEFNYRQSVDLLQANIRAKESEIQETRIELDKVKTKIEQVDYALEHLLAHKAFNNFIRKRINDKQYESHIGLISIIRRDFETLSDLFTEITVDADAPEEVQDTQRQKKENHEQLASLFEEEKTLDRIILYIDDLDRCPDQKVLEVIQAVHLIMAFPLFNVVVGVDPRCVNNALLLKTKLEYLKIAPLEKIEGLGIRMINPGEYLEKIFQIPFELKQPSRKAVKYFVSNLLKGQIENPSTGTKTSDEPTPDTTNPEQRVTTPSHSMPKTTTLIDELLLHKAGNPQEAEELVSTAPRSLNLSEDEGLLLGEMAILVGSTPRTIKRFINIYRIIRAHKQSGAAAFDQTDHLAIMFLLAITIGEKRSLTSELPKLVHSGANITLADFFEATPALQKHVRDIKQSNTLAELLEVDGAVLSKHLSFVQRFSFGGGLAEGKDMAEALVPVDDLAGLDQVK